MASQIPPKPDTMSLIQMCRWELDRLRAVASEFRNCTEISCQFLESAQTELKSGNGSQAGLDLAAAQAPPPRTAGVDIQICRDRAEEHRAFAERASDPRVKKLLLKIAEGYEKISDRE
jgi:hypothetical protein